MPVPKLLFMAALFFGCLTSFAQREGNRKLSVFIDCKGAGCDENFIRTEINLVDFLNERSAADVHVLITSLPTGGGMEQYQLIFYGQGKHLARTDTLRFTTKVNATQAEKRENLVQFVKLGLVPFIANTSVATAIHIGMKQETAGKQIEKSTDKWGYVVFNVNAEGSISADQNYTNQVGAGSFSMNRTTDKLRFLLGTDGSKYLYTFKVKDSSGTKKYEVNNTAYAFQHYLVASLGEHFSVGYIGRYSGNTFLNTKSKWYVSPVLELNLFNYADINNRSFLIRYGADFTSFQYVDTTLYNKKGEKLYGHEASLSVNFNQKWGSISSGAYYRNYFRNPDLYSTGANMTFTVRIAGGLSFYVSGTGNIIHDQVYLLKGAATEQEILIRRRQLESSFDYYTSVGLLFRFGSKLNNFVNQRISGYRGF
jgi:hypothetical protein